MHIRPVAALAQASTSADTEFMTLLFNIFKELHDLHGYVCSTTSDPLSRPVTEHLLEFQGAPAASPASCRSGSHIQTNVLP